jgi:hypothetical protein
MYVYIYIGCGSETSVDALALVGGVRGARDPDDDQPGKAAFPVQGSGFRVQGSGFRDQGSGFRVQGSGFRVQGSESRVQGVGVR